MPVCSKVIGEVIGTTGYQEVRGLSVLNNQEIFFSFSRIAMADEKWSPSQHMPFTSTLIQDEIKGQRNSLAPSLDTLTPLLW